MEQKGPVSAARYTAVFLGAFPGLAVGYINPPMLVQRLARR